MSGYLYFTYSQMAPILEHSYRRHKPLNIFSLYETMSAIASSDPIPFPPADPPWGSCSDSDFMERMDTIPFILQKPAVSKTQGHVPQAEENAVFSIQQNQFKMMVHRHYNYLLEAEHSHDYIEAYFVISGTCLLRFPNRNIHLQKGDMIFIAPEARHFIENHQKENFVLNISFRGSSIEGLFFQQLSYDTILSSFFRKIVYEKKDLNYILFHTNEDPSIKGALKNIAMETALQDAYNEIVYTSWTNIVFSILLRKYSEDVETDPPLENNKFSRVLTYIADHYDTVSLDELAVRFSYSKPHICNLIKKHTGYTLTDLVNKQKLAKAENLLETTNFSVEEISEIIGFTSADYFSRLFRSTYGVSPGKFRKRKQSGI